MSYTPEQIEQAFREWWASSYPHAPVNKQNIAIVVEFVSSLPDLLASAGRSAT